MYLKKSAYLNTFENLELSGDSVMLTSEVHTATTPDTADTNTPVE
jgi:hypothetical protein